MKAGPDDKDAHANMPEEPHDQTSPTDRQTDPKLVLGNSNVREEPHDQTSPTDRQTDPINAELERALFKRFWTWLAIVGSVVIIVVSGFSVIVSQAVSYVVRERVEVKVNEALNRIGDLEKRTLDTIGDLQKRMIDAAVAATTQQTRTAEAASAAAANAKEAEQSANESKKLLATNKDISSGGVNLGTDQLKKLIDDLVRTPDFATLVAQRPEI